MILDMSPDQFRRAASMWGIALCVLVAAAGWVFMKFGSAWSIADLPPSNYFYLIVPVYVVAEVAMIPVGAKLTDRFGCRTMVAVGPSIYIISSMICIISTSVEMLIVFRFLQGIGGGLLLGLAFTSVGRLYPPLDRGKCNELMTAAFAIGSLFGTATGYFITDTFNWRTGFVAFSACMLVGMVIAWFLLPREEEKAEGVDIPGMVIAAAVFGSAALYTQLVNDRFGLITLTSAVFAAVVILLVGMLVYRSYHCEHPTMPTHTTRFEKTHILLMFMFSVCGLGLIQYFFKLYLMYYEFNIYKASSIFLALLAGAAITSMIGGRLVFKTGARPWIVSGAAFVTVGLLLTHQIADKGVLYMGIALAVFGFGLGCIVTEILCSMQSVVPAKHMGQHTGNLMAVRMVGILAGNALIGSYIAEVIDTGREMTVIDLSSTQDLMSNISEHLTKALDYVAGALDSGFLTTTVILAMVTALLTAVAHTLGRDDVEALEECAEEDEGSE